MKALSIKEPWASLIASGEKTIETRTWPTDYRGDILLCASKYPASHLSGMAFAIATLSDCRPMKPSDVWDAQCQCYDGAFAWVLTNIRKIVPFPVKGQLRLFEVNVDHVDSIFGSAIIPRLPKVLRK